MQNGSTDSAFFQPQLLERNYGENVEQQLGQADHQVSHGQVEQEEVQLRDWQDDRQKERCL